MLEIEEEQALRERLLSFIPVYKQGADDYILHFAENFPEVYEEEHGWHSLIFIHDHLMESVSSSWDDVKICLDHYTEACSGLCEEFLKEMIWPIENEVQDQLRSWWKQTWRTHNLDFHIPPAPHPLPKTLIKIDKYSYHYGQLIVKFDGEKKWRKAFIYCGERALDRIEAGSVNINKIASIEQLCRDHILPLLRLCDWEQYENLTSQQFNALKKRYMKIKEGQRLLEEAQRKCWKAKSYAKGIDILINERAEKKGA